MRHRIILLLVFFGALNGLAAQSKKEAGALLQRDLEAYRRHTLAMNFDSSFTYMPPKMFDVVPRDTLLEMIRQSMNNEYVSIQMTGLDFKSKSKIKIKKAGAYYWALVPYDGSMVMQMKGEEGYKSLLMSMMRSQFGEKNVTEEGESGMRIQLKDKNLIAFKDPALPVWSLLEDKRKDKNPMQTALYEAAIPEEVRKAIK
jgi:hypothetical protein